MFSGKTEELLSRVRRAEIAKLKVQLFKPEIDDRYTEGHVESHNTTKHPAMVIKNASQILSLLNDRTRVVAIDEAQFFEYDLISVVEKLANRGLRVIIAALDMDYRANPYNVISVLLSTSEEVMKLSAICNRCGENASRTQRLVDKDEDVLIGGSDMYEARCRSCHESKGK